MSEHYRNYLTIFSIESTLPNFLSSCLTLSSPKLVTKSSIMLGLGESDEEVRQTMRDLRAIGVEALTLGQYLRSTQFCRFFLTFLTIFRLTAVGFSSLAHHLAVSGPRGNTGWFGHHPRTLLLPIFCFLKSPDRPTLTSS